MSFSSPEPKSGSEGADKRRPPKELVSQPTRAQQAIARGALRKALALNAEDFRFALRLAADHMRKGDLGSAITIYVGLMLCEPMNPEFLTGLAICALHAGEYHLALQAAAALLAIEPENFRGYYISGRASLGLRRKDKAEADLKRALRLASGPGSASFVAGVQTLLRKLETFKEASA